MGLWGTAHASADNKPKNYPVDENSEYNKGDIFANNSGWVRKAGTAASGNDNVNAFALATVLTKKVVSSVKPAIAVPPFAL